MPEDASDKYKYWAFISYSQNDRRWAEWVHRKLESYRIPQKLVGQHTSKGVVPKRFRPIFRDRDELPASSDLSAALRDALRQSRNLIVICSPDSARSRWVNEEILTFKRLGREDRILCLIVSGEPFASDGDGVPSRECFAPALRTSPGFDGQPANHRVEPMAADVRSGGDKKAGARLKLAAGIAGVGFDELKRRDRLRRRRAYLLSAAVLILVAALPVRLIFKSPRAAWMPAEFEGSNIARAGFLGEPDGSETIRLLLTGEIVSAVEERRSTKHVVLDLDTRGRITGELAYIDRNGTVKPELVNVQNYVPPGTLEDERRIFEALFTENKYFRPAVWDMPVFLFRDSPSRVDPQTRSLAPAKWPEVEEEAEFDLFDRLGDRIRSTRGGTRPEPGPHYSTVFRLDSMRLLAFVNIQLDGKKEFGSQSLGSRSYRSDDGGRGWQVGDATRIVASGITAVAKATPDGRILYLSSLDTYLSEDYSGGSGAIYRSSNAGITWERVRLPQPWDKWRSFSGVAVSQKDPNTIAIAISSQQAAGARVRGTPGVLISTNAGASWTLLVEGLVSPGPGRIQLLGVSQSRNVYGVLEGQPRNSYNPLHGPGRLIIWRRLSLVERLQGNYGIPD